MTDNVPKEGYILARVELDPQNEDVYLISGRKPITFYQESPGKLYYSRGKSMTGKLKSLEEADAEEMVSYSFHPSVSSLQKIYLSPAPQAVLKVVPESQVFTFLEGFLYNSGKLRVDSILWEPEHQCVVCGKERPGHSLILSERLPPLICNFCLQRYGKSTPRFSWEEAASLVKKKYKVPVVKVGLTRIIYPEGFAKWYVDRRKA